MALGTLLERLFVSIQADLSGLTDEMRDAAQRTEKFTGDISRKLGRIGEASARVGASLSRSLTLPVGALGAGLIKVASDAEETQAKFETVFRDLSSEVQEWAKTTGAELNRSRFDIIQYASSFQDTFVPLGFAREEAASLSKSVTQLGIDLASFNNIAESDAMEALQSALIGNHETVRRFGVIISQATLDQELFNMGIRGGVREASELEKVQARLNLIMRGTTDAQGDAARTSESFANQFRGLRAQIQEVGVQLGQILLPIATQVVGALTSMVSWFGSLSKETQTYIVIAAGLAAALGPVLVGFGLMVSSLGALVSLVPAVVSGLKLVGVAFTFATGPIGIIITAIAAVGTAILIFRDEIKEFLISWYTFLDELSGGRLTQALQTVISGFSSMYRSLITVTQASVTTVSDTWRLFPDALIDVAKTAANGFIEIMEMMVQAAVDRINFLLEKLNSISEFVGGGELVNQIGEISFDNLKFETSGAARKIAANFADNLRRAQIDFDFSDQIRASGQFDESVFEPLTQSSEQVRQNLSDAVSSLGTGIPSATSAAKSSLGSLGKTVKEEVADPIKQAGDDIASTLTGAFRSAFRDGEFSFRDFAKNLLTSFSDLFLKQAEQGIASLFNSVLSGSGAGGSGGLGGTLASIFGSLFGGFRAGGGVVMPWKSFVAGERGAELIQQDGPSGARRVATAGRTARMGGMSGGSVNVTVSGARGNAEIRDMVRQGVIEGIGQYDRGVGSRVDTNLARRG